MFEHSQEEGESSDCLLSISQGDRCATKNALRFHTLAAGNGWNEPALKVTLNEDVLTEMACWYDKATLNSLIDLAIPLDNLLCQQHSPCHRIPAEPMQLSRTCLSAGERERGDTAIKSVSTVGSQIIAFTIVWSGENYQTHLPKNWEMVEIPHPHMLSSFSIPTSCCFNIQVQIWFLRLCSLFQWLLSHWKFHWPRDCMQTSDSSLQIPKTHTCEYHRRTSSRTRTSYLLHQNHPSSSQCPTSWGNSVSHHCLCWSAARSWATLVAVSLSHHLLDG